MNSSINFANFLELLLRSDDEFESYGLVPTVPLTAQPGKRAAYTRPRHATRDTEPDTWYGE